jgi:hypothetical protein
VSSPETAEQRLAKTNNRSVVGVMNEITGPDDLTWLSRTLAQTPCSPLYGRHISPGRELAATLTE